MNTIKDFLNKYVSPVAYLSLGALLITGATKLRGELQKADQLSHIEKVVSYHSDAEKINDYYFTVGEKTRVATIRATLVAIDKYLPQYFPEGPYNRKDLIAMAMAESTFDQYLTGSKKEFGIFQIMPEMAKHLGVNKNQFDIDVNTEMALRVLKDKYAQHKDYKKAIIAYNGYFFKTDGKLYDAYWKRFLRFRSKLDDLFPDPISK